MARSVFRDKFPSKDTVRLHSADADEQFCQPCETEGMMIAANGYCQNCSEFFCVECVKAHTKQKISKSHTILKGDKMPKGIGVEDDQSYVMCDKHPTVGVKFYCLDHDTVGCSECIVNEHGVCNHNERVKLISNMSDKELASIADIDAVRDRISDIESDLSKQELSLTSDITFTNTQNTSLVNSIRTCRKDMNIRLDELEIAAWKEVDSMISNNEKTLKDLQDKTLDIKEKVTGTRQNLKAKENDIRSLFVLVKQAVTTLEEHKKELSTVSNRAKRSQYRFQPSHELNKELANHISLGKLIVMGTSDLSAKFQKDIFIKTDSDTDDCVPAGIGFIGKDKIVVADSNNNVIKVVDLQTGNVQTSDKLSSSPRALAVLSPQKIIVTFPSVKRVKSFTISEDIKVHREKKTDGKCIGIACKDELLAVSYENSDKIDVMDTKWKVMNTIIPKQNKTQDFLKSSRYIVFGHEEQTLIITDNDTDIVSVVNFLGEILLSFRDTFLRNPRGLAVTADGTVIVASCANGCVFLIDADFRQSNMVLKEDENISYPEAILYDDSNNRMYIWCSTLGTRPEIDNTIKVYEL
ncbi:Transcription intermediary factor 1-alpha [Mactra antiquata]